MNKVYEDDYVLIEINRGKEIFLHNKRDFDRGRELGHPLRRPSKIRVLLEERCMLVTCPDNMPLLGIEDGRPAFIASTYRTDWSTRGRDD